MNKPLVSVFISYYNDAKFLRKSIESVLAQNFCDFQLILLNHASTDNSREIAHSFNDKRIIHIDKRHNAGAGCGLLLRDMLAHATGRYIKFFCADDVMRPNCIGTLVDFMERNADCAMVCSRMDFIDHLGRSINYKNVACGGGDLTARDIMRQLMRGETSIYYPTVMVRRSALEHAYIDDSAITTLDIGMWCDLLSRGGRMHYLDDKLVSYRIHDANVSRMFDGRMDPRLFFERIPYSAIINNITDIETVRDLCSDVPYVAKLGPRDKKYIPFIFAVHNMKGDDISAAISGYIYLHGLMNMPRMRDALIRRFGFSVREFRDLYVNSHAFNKYLQNAAKYIGAGTLLKLILRRILHFIAPKNWRWNLFRQTMNKS
ncbi:MAG: glycosyltransferase [Alphaproteobacteria bacterium]|nr:glycosyltransferase [Alphaproteobacteria bacterium]